MAALQFSIIGFPCDMKTAHVPLEAEATYFPRPQTGIGNSESREPAIEAFTKATHADAMSSLSCAHAACLSTPVRRLRAGPPNRTLPAVDP